MSKFGIYVKFTAHNGKRDTLVEALMDASTLMQNFRDCELYIVNISEAESDVVWVSEVWSNKKAHEDSLKIEQIKAIIQRAMPLIAGIEQIKIIPVGGKGLS
jgi:quinol monooxygenase YgiN